MNSMNNLKESYFIRAINFLAISAELVAVYYAIQSSVSADFTYGFHSISLIWSILYHLFPYLRTNAVFKFFAQTISSGMLMLTIINVYMYIIATEWSILVYLGLLVFFTGPAALVAISILMMLEFQAIAENRESSPSCIMYISPDLVQLQTESNLKMI